MIKSNEVKTKLVASREAYGQQLVDLGQKHTKLVVLEAGMSNSTYSELFAKQFPKRYFPLFIAEQNAIGVAVGLAKRGFIPFVSTFAAFWTRAHDQIRMASYSQANLKICGSHAGLSAGPDGISQMGLEDLAMFRSVYNSIILCPSDSVSTAKLVELAYQTPCLAYLRTSKIATPLIYSANSKFSIPGLTVLKQSPKDTVAIVAAGLTVHQALAAHKVLSQENLSVRIIDLYCIKPINEKQLSKALTGIKQVLTVEDHYSEGGLGEAVRSALSNSSYQISSLAINQLPKSGRFEELMAFAKIDKKAIVDKVKQLF